MMFPLFFFVCSILSLVAALPVIRDVWVPPILSPANTTIWVAGQTYAVTWDISGKPNQVTNPTGSIYLRRGGLTQSSPIAKGFPLTDGSVNVTVPSTTYPNDDQWCIVLFGDSGNFSPNFTIQAASSS